MDGSQIQCLSAPSRFDEGEIEDESQKGGACLPN
jgi:hypothetical protein